METRRQRHGTDHNGSSFDSFREEEGIRKEVEAVVIKRVLVWRRQRKQHRAVAVKTKRP